MAQSRIALVTGATQGLGLALVEGLAQQLSANDHIFLTGRDPGRVAQEARRLADSDARVHGVVMDVTDTAAVQAVADTITADYDGIDIVISNAGARMSPDRSPVEEIDSIADVYNFGATRMLRSFGPILRPGGRFLVVASAFGTLGHLDPSVRGRFDALSDLDDVDALVDDWRKAVHDDTAEAQGWPQWLNVPSKVAQVAAVRVVAGARRRSDLADDTLVAAVCPGLIDTDASRPWFTDMSKAQTPEQAAVALIDLVLAPSVDPATYGELIQFGTVLPWRDEIAPEAQASSRVVSNTATA